MNTTNKTTEERVEELRNKYKLKDNTIYCSDDSEFCNDIRQALTQAHQQGEREGAENLVKLFIEIFKKKGLSKAVNMMKALQQPEPLVGKE